MKVHCCDMRGEIIKDEDIRIVLDGYCIKQGPDICIFPNMVSIGAKTDFCSFDCLARWALGQQKRLEENRTISDRLREYYNRRNI